MVSANGNSLTKTFQIIENPSAGVPPSRAVLRELFYRLMGPAATFLWSPEPDYFLTQDGSREWAFLHLLHATGLFLPPHIRLTFLAPLPSLLTHDHLL